MRSSATRSAGAAESAADTVDEGGHFDLRQCFLGRHGNALGESEIIGFLHLAADERVGFALQNTGGTDHYVVERLGRCKRHDGYAVFIAQGDGSAGGLGRHVGHQSTLGAFTYVLRHTGRTAYHQHTAGDGAFAVVVQRSVSVVGGAADEGDTAGDLDDAVGIDAVTRCVDEQITAEDLDFRRGGGEGIFSGAGGPR